MQAMSVIEIEQRRRTQLTPWMGFHVSDRNQIDNLLITCCTQFSDITLLSIQFLPLLP